MKPSSNSSFIFYSSYSPLFQKGLTLIELLVSMLIASIIFGGVIAVVQSSRSNYTSEQESAFMQENTRFAIELLTRDIRMAGALGCANKESVALANVLGNTGGSVSTNLGGLIDNENATGLKGYEGSAEENFPAAIMQTGESQSEPGASRSDAIIIRYANADTRVAKPLRQHVKDDALLDLNLISGQSNNFEVGGKAAIVDANCRHAAIFQITSVSGASLGYGGDAGGNLPGNCVSDQIYSNDSFSCFNRQNRSSSSLYNVGSMVFPFVAHAYYIDDSKLVPGVPALKRTVMNASGARPEELAQGVESLNFEYGVDSDNDGDVNGFVTADNVEDWNDVLAVRFSVVLRSQTEALTESREVTVGGQTFNDRYLRQFVTSTVALRN